MVDFALVRQRRAARPRVVRLALHSRRSLVDSPGGGAERVAPRDGAHRSEVIVVPGVLQHVERDEAGRGELACCAGCGGGGWEAGGRRGTQGGEAEAGAKGDGCEVTEEAVSVERNDSVAGRKGSIAKNALLR